MIWQAWLAIVVVFVVIYTIVAKKLTMVPSSMFFMTLLGVIVGLSVGTLLSLPLAKIGGVWGVWLPLLVNVFSVALVTTFFYNQREQIAGSLNQVINLINTLAQETKWIRRSAGTGMDEGGIVLDTSVIIDGRIIDLVRTGFMGGRLLVAKFVLDELQLVADSEDAIRRNKGRRGLETLEELRHERGVRLEVVEDDFVNEADVDSKVIRLAKKYRAKLMTVDYNLNRVARIQNVNVLNVNELNNALRPVVLPGEAMHLRVIQGGKDVGQGVGYLDDGTMVVVEGGDKFIGQELDVVVTRVFQTVAGKMIFTMPKEKYQERRKVI
jgi:uncharacterized protein YacL